MYLGGTLLATVAIGKKIIVRDIAICWRQKNQILEDWIATMEAHWQTASGQWQWCCLLAILFGSGSDRHKDTGEFRIY